MATKHTNNMTKKKATTPAVEKPAKNQPSRAMKAKHISIFLDELDNSDEEEGDDADAADEGKGKIWHILKCYIKGYTRSEIVNEGGYNRSTVYRQCGEYDKLRKAPATHYQGFEVFEMRVKRVMGAKKCTREEAVEIIYAKDLD